MIHTLFLALVIVTILGSTTLASELGYQLSKKCPQTGLYQDSQGYCRPVQPYSKLNASYHGLWKLEPRDIKLRPEKIDLGRLLFFDPILSKAGTMACVSCHEPRKAFSGKHDGLRSSPGLINLAYNPRFFWDGRAESASDQIKEPLLSPVEMGNTSLESVLARLNQNESYRVLFAATRADKNITKSISWLELVSVLDSFQKSLITFTAPYDRYVLGDLAALSDSQAKGLKLFRSFATRCAECHTPPLFTNHQILTVGAPGESRPLKVPTLRQITKTAPYTHRGAFETLRDVVKFYNDGGGRSKNGISGKETHWHVRPIGLTADEQQDLVDFLGALTDDSWHVEIPQSLPSGLKTVNVN
jgi:cytochrome c peroxidase